MKTYLEQLEQLERLPENHFCFEPVTSLPEVPISSRKPRLRLSVITLAANDAQLVGGTLAEVLEGKLLRELRSVEGRVERTVFLAVHVDVSSFIHVRISLHHLVLFLLGVVLHECEVVFAVVRNGSIQILANSHAPWLLSHQLEVDTQFCVWVENHFRHNCRLSGYSLCFDERGPPFRISQIRNRLRSALAQV